jgi:hypothetical protein
MVPDLLEAGIEDRRGELGAPVKVKSGMSA